MKNRKPVKRHNALKPLSRDHHEGLLLCWKIGIGLKKNVEIERIKRYTDWFFINHLLPHFEMEEKYIFPILRNEKELIKKALAEHKKLKLLFESGNDIKNNLNLIIKELESHIRFEERILFNEIQKVSTAQEMAQIEALHEETHICDIWSDEFWKENIWDKIKN